MVRCNMFVWYAMEGLHNPLTLYFPWVAESSRQVRRIEKKTRLGDYKLIQYQILQIEIMSILWQTVGRITYEILGIKGLSLTSD